MEKESFLTKQIITYLGNKRKLLDFIGSEVKEILQKEGKEKCRIFDGFSGSGIVSRYLKQYASKLYVNDFEEYTKVINECYLSNHSEVDINKITEINNYLNQNKLNSDGGIIRSLYSPVDDSNIIETDRAFYTNENALIIDNIRSMIDEIDVDYKKFFIAPLLYEASVHTNTSGVFKGFYKDKHTKIGKFGGTGENALNRIKGTIHLPIPIFSNYECDVEIHNTDTNELIKVMDDVDITYYDPPYNQHPYGSNYFMLNVINKHEIPQNISKVSGIPSNWNKSPYYRKKDVINSFDDLIENTPSKWILLSYNNEGLMSEGDIISIMSKYGTVELKKQKYNTFRGSKNLNNRDLYVDEFLYVLKKH
jgi:adenine-specific DNA-methyltransferase